MSGGLKMGAIDRRPILTRSGFTLLSVLTFTVLRLRVNYQS